MTEDPPPDFAVRAAEAVGTVRPGEYRVVVLESSGAIRTRDFHTLEAARGYANDAASESDEPAPLAYVFDDALRFVGRGRHYAAS